MNSYERINDVLVNLFRDILYLEEQALKETGYKDLTMNDWHVIEAVGTGEPKSMSQIAKELSVTVGSLTIAMNGLCKKGYAMRARGQKDRRVVNISLTEQGVAAHERHAQFHREMIDAVIADQSEAEIDALVRSLSKLTTFFRGFGKKREEHPTEEA